jgi:hypothetical protein
MMRIPLHQEGRLAIVTKRGAGCGGREAPSRAFMRVDERRSCVRRSRVVLTPRRWRQVAWSYSRGDGGKKAGHRGEHEISRQTIAQGRPDCFRFTCMLVCVFLMCICTRDRGCSAHPVFPAPSILVGADDFEKLGQVLSRERFSSSRPPSRDPYSASSCAMCGRYRPN